MMRPTLKAATLMVATAVDHVLTLSIVFIVIVQESTLEMQKTMLFLETAFARMSTTMRTAIMMDLIAVQICIYSRSIAQNAYVNKVQKITLVTKINKFKYLSSYIAHDLHPILGL